MTAWRAAARGASNVAARSGSQPDCLPPGRMPVRADWHDRLPVDPAEERRLVQQRVSDAAVAPIQQDEAARVASNVARMKISVDQPIGQAARVDRGQAGRQIRDKAFERRAIAFVQRGAGTFDQLADCDRQRRAAPVGEPDGEQLT